MSERYYLSEQDLADRLAEMPGIEEGADYSTSCPYRSFDDSGPCGGCDACITAQQVYYFYREREWARLVHEAGLELANPRIVTLEWPVIGHAPYHGEGGYHCWTSGEIESPVFPWNRKVGI